MAELVRQMAQIIRVDADAVAADQPRLERQEVPLGPRRGEHVPHRQPDLREDLRDLVHEGDVDVALGVLDRFRGFGGLDRRRPEHAALGHRAVDLRELLDDLRVLAGDDFGDPVDGMLTVAGIDPFRRVAEPEVAPPLEPRGDVAELRVHVRRTEDARLDGMMDLSEPHALIESVRDDLVGFLEDLDLELLLVRTVRADGRDVGARPDPFPPDERLPGGRYGDHDIGAADRLLDGLRGQDADAMELLHLLRKGRRPAGKRKDECGSYSAPPD